MLHSLSIENKDRFVGLSLHLPVCLSVSLSEYTFVCLPVYLSACLHAYRLYVSPLFCWPYNIQTSQYIQSLVFDRLAFISQRPTKRPTVFDLMLFKARGIEIKNLKQRPRSDKAKKEEEQKHQKKDTHQLPTKGKLYCLNTLSLTTRLTI